MAKKQHYGGLPKSSLNEFKKEEYDLEGDEYSVLGEYINTNTPIRMKHNTCGYDEWMVTPHNFKGTPSRKGRRCPKCNDSTFDYSFVKQYIEKEGYKLLTNNYINVFQKLTLECPKGHKFEITFHNFKNGGRRCPRCKFSKGEKEIAEILNKENIKYESQKTFEYCKDKKALPFDFYLPNYNLIIEYDGEQHFDIKHSFDGEKSFWETILHDAIKNSYCEDNNINILRIPFWEFDNIERLIKEKLIILGENFND